MNDSRIAYLNARLLDPETGMDAIGALLIEDGRIADFGINLFKYGAPSVSETIDCNGMCLAPGLIDMRVQLREPGAEHEETIESACDAASAGGVTSMICLPNTNPIIDDMSVVDFITRQARDLKRTRIYCYGAITNQMAGKELTEIGLLTDAGAVAFCDGEYALKDAKVMQRALSYSKSFDALIVQHPEYPDLAGGAMNSGELATRLGLSSVNPIAEVMMIERDLRLVEATNARYHVAHISTKSAVDVIRNAKYQGLKVTCDTAPHYFALNETSVGDYRTFAKVSPPLRGEFDRQSIVEGLKDGTIDAIASDHSPHNPDSKRLPFEQASYGVIGIETLLPLTLELYHNGHLSLLEALEKTTIAPAKLLKISGGRIKRGAPADLILFDPDIPWKIEEDKLKSKSKNSAFGGRPVQGQVIRTIVGGKTLYKRE